MSAREDGLTVARIVGRGVLGEAFGGTDLGDFGLTALVEEVSEVEGDLPNAPGLATSFLKVSGNFVDRIGTPCGQYERFIYWHARTGEAELYLRSLTVDESRRGGVGQQFRERSFTALSRAGIRRVRAIGGGSAGTYALARDGFDFDVERLPGFGADELIAPGDELRPLPRQGDLVQSLVERLIDAAVADGRISASEADWIRTNELRSSPELAAFPLRHLSRRLLDDACYPQVFEI